MAGRDALSDVGGEPEPADRRGPRSGIRLRMIPLADIERACADLERAIQGQVLRGLTVTLEVDRAPTVPQLRRLEELLLDRHGAQLLQVVEVVAASAAQGEQEPPAAWPAAQAVGAVAAGEGPAAAAEDHGRRGAPLAEGAFASGEARRARSTRAHRQRGGGRALPLARPATRASAYAGSGLESVPPQRPQGSAAGDAGSLLASVAETVPTMLVKRTLRSGQRVRFAGNVVVLGDVNPGAEVVAAGDIVVMGTLRGVAHAGATGGADAIVAAFRLHPTQLRVGAVIGRAPDGLVPRPEAPEVARVRDGVLVVERYVP